MPTSTVLSNQLRVITEKVPSARSVAIGILVDVGSQDDPVDKGGIAHLTEHALFLGTSNRDARAISRLIDEAGGQMGAFTGRDYTCFYAHIMEDYTPFAWELLGDIILNSTFPDEGLATERDVILQEIDIQSDDVSSQLYDRLSSRIWASHPLGRPILGSSDSVSQISREDIIYFAGQNYLPDRMTIAVVGNVDHDDAVNHAEDAFWRLLGGSKQRKPEPCNFEGARLLHQGAVTNSYFALAFPAAPYNSPSRYCTHALNTILGAGMSSKLYNVLREQRGWVYDVRSSYMAYRDAGLIWIEGVSRPDFLDDVIRAILHELEQIANDGVSEEDLYRTKKRMVGQHLLSSDCLHTRMSRILTQQYYLHQLLDESEIVSGIEEVTQHGVKNAAQQLLSADLLGLAVTQPEKSEPSEFIQQFDMTACLS